MEDDINHYKYGRWPQLFLKRKTTLIIHSFKKSKISALPIIDLVYNDKQCRINNGVTMLTISCVDNVTSIKKQTFPLILYLLDTLKGGCSKKL